MAGLWSRSRAGMAVVVMIAGLLAQSAAWGFSARALMHPTGEALGDWFGESVSDAGDVNGDGYADVIVGAYSNDVGGSGAGRAYVYYGGPAADNAADLTLTGEVGSFFGTSVSGAGDVNGDGYADIIVGAAGYNSYQGRAYVYYGGPGADTVPDLTLTGEATDDAFGASVSGAGDVNGDGYGDIIVGADPTFAASANTGRAYVYYGGPGADNVADLTLTGEAANDAFGFSVSGAGDFSGDGYADVVVGAQGNDAGGANAGRAYVYYGGPGADNVADLTLTGGTAGDLFGISVSGAGDVNGDGYADVIVGASGNDVAGTDAGQAHVFHGGPGADTVADWTLTGEAAEDRFGYSVSGAGDVNGDGYPDVIAGAYSNDAAGSIAGRAYVFYAGPAADTVADVTLTGEAAYDAFGLSVSGGGDVNGDGYADVVVGAWQDGGGDNATGRAYVYTSRPYDVLSPNGGEQWVSGGPRSVRWLGGDLADIWLSPDGGATYSLLVAGVGGGESNEHTIVVPATPTAAALVRVSANGEPVTFASSDRSDGVFAIVAPHHPPAAAARLYATFTGTTDSDNLGSALAGAGDVNGDGFDDLIVGVPGGDAGVADAGHALLFYGGPGADDVPDLTFTGEAAFDQFGSAVGAAGDLNADGYDDVIVGAFGSDAGAADGGRAYVYFGGPGADAVADLTLTGTEAIAWFGNSVAGIGDFNGDGNDDVVVGALFSDGNGTDAGRAYVFYGGPLLDNVSDLALTGTAAFDLFGYAVAGAGDVNGDGFGDVIVGAYGNDAGGAEAGRAYVFYGGAADNVPDLVFTGANAGDNFGRAVAGAGDVNGDGFDDMVVGAEANDGGGIDAGRAYVFHGGPGADAEADLVLTGGAQGAGLGSSVAGAGDVNSDGYDDLIVGANLGASGNGRAHVYYGGPGAGAGADVTFTGAEPFAGFGGAVAGIGDWNGDGHDDVIVGSPYQDDGGSDRGRTYFYDMNRYHLLAPIGGETWNVGAMEVISWLGSEPADLWLSVNGGASYSLLAASVGGAQSNTVPLQVPHAPTKFAKIRLTPSDASADGGDASDSLFTIETSVSLLALLAAPLPQGGATISWRTDPGPEDLAGYRLERAEVGRSDWRTIAALTRETSYTDPSGGPGSRYRLFAVNGLGEELWLGEATIRPLASLAAWPLPYHGGDLAISFATAGGLGTGGARTEVAVYDVRGRLVRRIAHGSWTQGYHTVTWNGRDARGREVAAGIYFLRSRSGGEETTLKLTVLR